MIPAIPTYYAGHHFRSRLEARWAVVFDTLGIKWEYERQGYLCSQRLSRLDDSSIWYLPDFWFPELESHGEVKGVLTNSELLRLLDVAASLSSNDGGGCHDAGGHDLIVFGNIPPPDDDRAGTQLHMHKGDLIAAPWIGGEVSCLGYGHPCGRAIAVDVGGDLEEIMETVENEDRWLTPERLGHWLTKGSHGSYLYSGDRAIWPDEQFRKWTAACDRARRARFEHGEHP